MKALWSHCTLQNFKKTIEHDEVGRIDYKYVLVPIGLVYVKSCKMVDFSLFSYYPLASYMLSLARWWTFHYLVSAY